MTEQLVEKWLAVAVAVAVAAVAGIAVGLAKTYFAVADES